MRRADARLKAALLLAAALSYPVLRGVLDGTIPTSAGAIRVALAVVLAYVAVVFVTSVVGSYLPEPAPAAVPELAGVEDAVVVEDLAAGEPAREDAP